MTFNNQAFAVTGLDGGRVDGTYTLTIDDDRGQQHRQLTGWSVTVDSELPTFVFQAGAPMDQNADGTPDENPLTMPGGYTGLTPGDVYAVPTPQLTAPVTFTSAAYTGGTNTGGYILSPPFNQNTLPLIVTGPQVALHRRPSAPRGSSPPAPATTCCTDDTTSQFEVTFDRPIQTSTFTPSQVLSIMGPLGSITGPQTFGSTAVDQSIPAATSAGPGTLDSTVTINSDGTLQIGDITVSLSIALRVGFRPHRGPGGARTGRRSRCSRAWAATGKNFVNTVFDDSAETSITAGTAPFTGTFMPEYTLNSATLTSLQGLVGRRHLARSRSPTPRPGPPARWTPGR